MVKQIINFVFIYVMVFWMVIFCILPIGIKREEKPLQGNDHGAPANSNIKKKLIYTAIISFIIVSVYFFLKENGVIDINALLA